MDRRESAVGEAGPNPHNPGKQRRRNAKSDHGSAQESNSRPKSLVVFVMPGNAAIQPIGYHLPRPIRQRSMIKMPELLARCPGTVWLSGVISCADVCGP